MYIRKKILLRFGMMIALSVLLSVCAPAFGSESENYINSPEVIDEGGGSAASPLYQTEFSVGQTAIDLSSYGGYVNHWGFMWIFPNPPESPFLVAPIDSAFVDSPALILVWDVPVDIDGDYLHFNVDIAESDIFGPSIIHSYNSAETPELFSPMPPLPDGDGVCSLFVPDFIPDGRYWWRVTACDPETCGIASLARNFWRETPPAAPSELIAETCGREVRLTWEFSPEEDVRGYKIYRGYEPEPLMQIDSLDDFLFPVIDIPFPSDTTYYYAVAAFDSFGYLSPLSNIESVYPYRYRVKGFRFELIGDERVELTWTPTNIDSEYILFFAEGDTFPSMAETLATIYPPDSSWISPYEFLSVGGTYTFAIYCRSLCDFIDLDERIYHIITVVDTAAITACRKVHIVKPNPGKSFTGNCIMIKADSDCPNTSLLNISSVLFQKRLLPGAEWTDIDNLSADSAQHPNPDSVYPYFVHWNVEEELDGEYLIRTIAFDTLGNPDPEPSSIPVIIDHFHPDYGSRLIPDSSKTIPSGYAFECFDRIYPHSSASIDIGDFDDTEDFMFVPEGAVAGPDIIYYRKRNLSYPVEPYFSAGEFFEVTVQSGALETTCPDSIHFLQQYPDFNDDGYIDRTAIPEDSLWFFKWTGSSWDSIANCSIDSILNQVSAKFKQFGDYSILSTDDETCIRILISDGHLHDGLEPETLYLSDTFFTHEDSSGFGQECIRLTAEDECLPQEIGIAWIDIYDIYCGLLDMTNGDPMYNEVALQGLFSSNPIPSGEPFAITDYVQWHALLTSTTDTSYLWFKAINSYSDDCYGAPDSIYNAHIQMKLHFRSYMP